MQSFKRFLLLVSGGTDSFNLPAADLCQGIGENKYQVLSLQIHVLSDLRSVMG